MSPSRSATLQRGSSEIHAVKQQSSEAFTASQLNIFDYFDCNDVSLDLSHYTSSVRDLASNWKLRARANLDAIRLAHSLSVLGRAATNEEREALNKFVGFGASELANRLFTTYAVNTDEWASMADELRGLVPSEAFTFLSQSTQYAHYTPETIIDALWHAIIRLGFTGGEILEPGCGTGLFLGRCPGSILPDSTFTGYELDPTTALIASKLYPSATINCVDYTKVEHTRPYDLALGNPPFSNRVVCNKTKLGSLGLTLHDYFIASSIFALAPGSIAAFVTSRGTMDKGNGTARAHLATLADLVAAIRLPKGALRATAGTEVVADVLFFRRHAGVSELPDQAWQNLSDVQIDGVTKSVNTYFLKNPDMVLGRHAIESSQYERNAYTCKGDIQTFEADLMALCQQLPEGIARPRTVLLVKPAIERASFAHKEDAYVLDSRNRLCQVSSGELLPVTVRSQKAAGGISSKAERLIRAYIPIRDAVRSVLAAQIHDFDSSTEQEGLHAAYLAFVKAFGPLNLVNIIRRVDPETGLESETQRRPNLAPFLDDPDCWLVASIEHYDLETGLGTEGAIFTTKVVSPPAVAEVKSASDALAVSLEALGHVDVDHVSSILGKDRTETIRALEERIYQVPRADGIEQWQTDDEYLSGSVRKKLKYAQKAAGEDQAFTRNVEALKAAQPADLVPAQITVRLGAPWIPTSDIEAFCKETLGVCTIIEHQPAVAAWNVNSLYLFLSSVNTVSSTTIWGTERRHAGLLLQDALNAKLPQIYDEVRDGEGGTRRELNVAETEVANERLRKIKNAFMNWIWKDGKRTDRLVEVYNRTYNDIVPREFNGAHLSLPGTSVTHALYAHQKRAIWRVVSSGTSYIAHAVGAGKSYALAGICMEQRRLGLVKKPLMIVPGHCLAQTSREFLQLYPMANLLVADEANFSKEKRQKFIAKATTGSWDCIILTHAAFKLIPTPVKFEMALIRDQVEELESILLATDTDNRITRKRLEARKEKYRQRLEQLKSCKDNMVTIQEMGVDQIIVDEAHALRKLSFATNMTNIKGVDPDGSQRAWDLYVKMRFVQTIQPTRPLVMASGTPITNTLGEMYTVLRFMDEEMLRERKVNEFDAWAATFADTKTDLELQPSGKYKPATRFADFVNLADLAAMFRSRSDVVLREDLLGLVKIPAIKTGTRQIITAPPSPAFKDYQKNVLEARIKEIESRKRAVRPKDDILLSVITDARHAAIDLRMVNREAENEPENKLNIMIANVFRIWRETEDEQYTLGRAGAGQLIFSDLGTKNALEARGFSAYIWIKERLVAMGVPSEQIAFMQDYKKTSDKQALFSAFNAGRVRIIIGSSETMSTGVNVQRRLKALHHLDVPWLPSFIEQREGRIIRQGNENSEIEIFAYATEGSVDAQMWQANERKKRFIDAALAGDKTVRQVDDIGSDVNQFALAKALASGDPRLLRKAGLEADLAHLDRLYIAHNQEQFTMRRNMRLLESDIEDALRVARGYDEDIARMIPTRGKDFSMRVGKQRFYERSEAAKALFRLLRSVMRTGDVYSSDGDEVGEIGSFVIRARRVMSSSTQEYSVRVAIDCAHGEAFFYVLDEEKPLGVVSRLENRVNDLKDEQTRHGLRLQRLQETLEGFQGRRETPFERETERQEKRGQLEELERLLEAGGSSDVKEAVAA